MHLEAGSNDSWGVLKMSGVTHSAVVSGRFPKLSTVKLTIDMFASQKMAHKINIIVLNKTFEIICAQKNGGYPAYISTLDQRESSEIPQRANGPVEAPRNHHSSNLAPGKNGAWTGPKASPFSRCEPRFTKWRE